MDRETFDRLVLEHLPMAQRFAIRLAGQPDLAEEIVQISLLRAHRAWMTFKGQSNFRTWFFQIIVNAFRDDLEHRARRNAETLSAEIADRDDKNPALLAETAELGRIVAKAVSSLPPRQREVIVLHTYERLTDGEIAAVLAINPQNVRTTLHLARQRLKEMLGPYLSDEHAGKPGQTI